MRDLDSHCQSIRRFKREHKPPYLLPGTNFMYAYRVTFRDGFAMIVRANTSKHAKSLSHQWARDLVRLPVVQAAPNPLGFRELRSIMTVASVVPMVSTGV